MSEEIPLINPVAKPQYIGFEGFLNADAFQLIFENLGAAIKIEPLREYKVMVIVPILEVKEKDGSWKKLITPVHGNPNAN